MSSGHPAPTFIALRAATLGIDDLDRRALRLWLGDAIDHRGALTGQPDPSDPLLRLFAAAIATLDDRDRQAYRQWAMRWTNYEGRIITPHERARRLEEITPTVATSAV